MIKTFSTPYKLKYELTFERTKYGHYEPILLYTTEAKWDGGNFLSLKTDKWLQIEV